MTKELLKVSGAVVLVVAVILTLQTFFTVDEREQVIVTQLGEYVRTINTPGLATKLPFIHGYAVRSASAGDPRSPSGVSKPG